MAYPSQTYPAAGSDYEVPFPYLDKSHVKVTVDGTLATYSWVTPTKVRIVPAPVSGQLVRVWRETSHDARMVDFVAPSVLDEDTLDTDSKQSFFMAQEAYGLAKEGFRPAPNGQWDAQGRRIQNVAEPAAASDAANKSYVAKFVERTMAGLVGGVGFFIQLGANAIQRTFQDKMRDIVSPLDYGAIGDGVTNDDAAFNALEIAHPGASVNLGGRSYVVSALRTVSEYTGGNFVVGSTVYPMTGNSALLSSALDTGARDNRHLRALLASTSSQSAGNQSVNVGSTGSAATGELSGNYSAQSSTASFARAVNMAAIYCTADGNLSGNIVARLSKAMGPQSVNIGTEECYVEATSRGSNISSFRSKTEGVSSTNLASRECAATGWEAANVASDSCVAGKGKWARARAVVVGGQIIGYEVLSPGEGYDTTGTVVVTDRGGVGKGALAKIGSFVNGHITEILMTNNGAKYASVPNVVITDAGGTGFGATAVARLDQGTVFAIDVVNCGANYTSPVITIDPPPVVEGYKQATAVAYPAKGGILTVVPGQDTNGVTQYGTGYVDPARIEVHFKVGDQQANIASDSARARASKSVNIASYLVDTEGLYSANIASTGSITKGEKSLVRASENSTTPGIMGIVIGSSGSHQSGVRGMVVGSRNVQNNLQRSLAMGDSTTVITAGSADQNLKLRLEGSTGVVRAVGGTTTTGFDYAELFEHVDHGVIPAGTIVARVGRKVRPASTGDRILGVVSKTAGVIGNEANFHWSGRYVRDDFGGIVTEPKMVVSFGGYEGLLELAPQPVPADAEMWIEEVPVENPEYDPSKPYVSRQERPAEYSVVGLMGQVFTRVGPDVGPDDYVAADGTKSLTATRLECMEIVKPYDAAAGFAVALCLLR